MKENEDYLKDLKDIKNMMERSSKFISLSGLSGVLAGIYALICAYFVYSNVYLNKSLWSPTESNIQDTYDNRVLLLGFGVATLILAISTGFFLTIRKAKRNKQKVFGKVAFQLLYNLAIPLVIGGVACLLILPYGGIIFIGPLTLIFYGLALINASQYTFSDIKSLGLVQCIIGLVSLYFLGYSLHFWALGFGVVHIIYGIIMYRKYDRT